MDNSQHQPPILQTPGDTQSQQEFMTTSTVEELPVEILQEIFLLLDCNTILSFIRTCRLFSDAANSRLLWYNVVDKIHAATGGLPNEELEKYSITSLRTWCMIRLQARTLWNSKSEVLPAVSQQKLRFSSGNWGPIEVLPGGRWMLFYLYKGGCCYVDLDSSKKSCQQLVCRRKGPDTEHTFCIGIDHSQPRLTFRLSIIGYQSQLIKVYQVVLEGHGRTAKLIARHISTLRAPIPGVSFISAINEFYYIDRFQSLQSRYTSSGHKLRLFYHKDCPRYIDIDKTMPYASMAPGLSCSECLEFISTYRFVSHSLGRSTMKSTLQIYDIVTCDGSNLPKAMNLLHQIPLFGLFGTVSISRVYHVFPDACRIVVFANGKVQGISIPHDNPQNSRITVFGTYPVLWKGGECYLNDSHVTVGYGATTVYYRRRIEVLTYGWNDDGTGVNFQRKVLSEGSYHMYALPVEETGRVIHHNEYGHVYIVGTCIPSSHNVS